MEEQPFDAEALGKIYAQAMRMCSQREKCEHDVAQWLERKGVPAQHAAVIIERLVDQKFIDNARYAAAYAREKMRLSGWGPQKVSAMLRGKRIEEGVVRSTVERVAEELGDGRLEVLLEKKLQGEWRRYLADPALRDRLLRFALGRGFPFDESLAAADRVLRRLREGGQE